jgi:glycerate kinase
MRILVVPDKFKGTLSAEQAADAIARGWAAVRPEDSLDLLPMSDGGDGFGEIMGRAIGAERQSGNVVNAAHESMSGEWWWSESSQTAVVESAKIIGLAMLPPGKFHPFELDTYGLGQMLRTIGSQRSKTRLLIGIGGSATNDAGFGMARGLGYRFVDSAGYSLERWPELDRLLTIERPPEPLEFSEVVIACDVQNPLLGETGASRVYGPQKGLREEDFPIADRCFERLVDVATKDLALKCEDEPGTGAAGGLGYGLRVFLGGSFRPGFEIFAEAARLRERITEADIVITGEGAIDRQTLMGKGTGAVAQLAKREGKRCIGLTGHTREKSGQDLFDLLLSIAPDFTNAEEAQRNAVHWLRVVATDAAGRISGSMPAAS